MEFRVERRRWRAPSVKTEQPEPKPEIETDQQKWLDENREAFEAANRAIEQYGIFNEADREW